MTLRSCLAPAALVSALLAGCAPGKQAGQKFTITVTASHVTVQPTGSVEVAPNATQAFTVTATSGFTLVTTVGGTCPAGNWSSGIYTTGAITADCSVSFSATANGTNWTVTPSGDSWETFTPSSPQTVANGQTQAFTVTAHNGDTLSHTVGGTCPVGSWSGDVYTTGAITTDCTVSFSATVNSVNWTVTPSGDSWETFTPPTPQTVSDGGTQSFTVAAQTDYVLSPTVGGTCPTGAWSESTYTTGAITADCTVAFAASLESFQVTPSGDDLESYTPDTAQSVNYGMTQSFTVSTSAGSNLSDVGGSCPGGAWTNDVVVGCYLWSSGGTVEMAANGTMSNDSSDDSGSWINNGDGTYTLSWQSEATDTLTLTGGNLRTTPGSSSGVLGIGTSCGDSTGASNTWTTGAITSDCGVSFGAASNTYVVTESQSAGVILGLTLQEQTVSLDGSATFQVGAADGYTLSTSVGGDCPQGSWIQSGVYKTGPVTIDCAVSFTAAANPYLVTSSGDGNETIDPNIGQTISFGQTASFTVTASANHTLSPTVGGSCLPGSWSGNVYTTGVIEGDCSVSFTAPVNHYGVTATGDSLESFSPSDTVNVDYGNTQSFTVTPESTDWLSTSVDGTCAAGSWANDPAVGCYAWFNGGTVEVNEDGTMNNSTGDHGTWAVQSGSYAFSWTSGFVDTLDYTGGNLRSPTNFVQGLREACQDETGTSNVYTTGTITGACEVEFAASPITYQVDASGDGQETIGPSSQQMVDSDSPGVFRVDPNPGYGVSQTVGGTCPAGSWNGDVYSTDSITTDCSVSFSATALTASYQVTISGDGSESLSPSGPVTVSGGQSQTVTVTANTGYTLNQFVSSTCPGGTWSGNQYTTGAITQNCTLQFSATANAYTVTPNGDGNESFSPGPRSITYGSTQTFTVTAANDYYLSSTVSGTCPVNSWANDFILGCYRWSDSSGGGNVEFSLSSLLGGTHQGNVTRNSPADTGYWTVLQNGSYIIEWDSGSFEYANLTDGNLYGTNGVTLTGLGQTCSDGTGTSNTYATGAIAGNCTVDFSASPFQ